MRFIHFLIMLSVVSCSFNSSDKSKSDSIRFNEELSADELARMDSDGDLVSDLVELSQGHDRFIADVPELNISFMQNYSIKVLHVDKTKFIINTKIERDNPDFEYQVGNLYLKDSSLSNAAGIGKYSDSSWGNIENQDLSMVSYPKVDNNFFQKKVIEFNKNGLKPILEINIKLENSLKLEIGSDFQSIEDLELNFYYKDHEKDTLVLIHTASIKKVFQAGIREEFKVTIINPPKALLKDSYLRRGEFIISKVKDFYIPKLKTKYSTLIQSVRNKTIPVYRTTPYGDELKYVSVSENSNTFNDILSKLFSDKYSVEDQKLVRVEQFSNNLSDFKFLHELKGIEKEGKWFVMTNKLQNHYLKHNYTKNDTITLSYITGNELASRSQETIFSKYDNAYTGGEENLIPIGKIGTNSSIDILIKPMRLKGPKLVRVPGQFSYSPPNCRNCSGTNWGISINFDINSIEKKDESFSYNSIEEVLKSIDVLINNNHLGIQGMLKTSDAKLKLIEDDEGQYIMISLFNLHKNELIKAGQENTAFIKIKPLNKGSAGIGFELKSASGNNVDVILKAGDVALFQAGNRNLPLAVTSWNFEKWQSYVPWGETRNDGYIPTRGERVKYFDGIEMAIATTITNNYN